MSIIIDILGLVIVKMTKLYSIYHINNEKIKKTEFIICLAIFGIISILTRGISNLVYRTLINFFGLVIISHVILKKDFRKAIVSTSFVYLIGLIIEIVFMILLAIICELFLKVSVSDVAYIIDKNIYFSLIFNIITSILFLLFSSLNIISKLYNSILIFIQKKYSKFGLMILGTSIFLLFFLYYLLIYSKDDMKSIICFVALLLLLLTLFAKDINIFLEYEKTKEKYNSTKQDLLDYEEMLDRYRIDNHENKNHLQMIRAMVKEKDNNVQKYIDTLIDDVYTKNEEIFLKVAILPSGLKAIFYTKIMSMEKNMINYTIDLDRSINYNTFFGNDTKFNLKICSIISIFIDNAIEEVISNDDKNIDISVYSISEDKLVFEIANTFNNVGNLESFSDKKYTTKTKGHGYGLTLAKELISSESRLKNEIIIEDDIFIQVLEIKKQ